jgi:hypothetical protein
MEIAIDSSLLQIENLRQPSTTKQSPVESEEVR